MQLSTIFEALTFGELKQLSIGGAEEDGIYPTHSKEVLGHLNLAMLNLYSRFPLNEKILQVRTQEDKYNYLLTSAFAESQNVEGYIIDTVDEPFTDDILRINSAFAEDESELTINDENAEKPLFIPSFNSIKIPNAVADENYFIIYRVKPATIVIPDGSNPSDVDVPLPETLLEALLTYVSARAQNARGGDKGKQEGLIAMQQYEQMCKDIELRNVLNNSHSNGNRKHELNGWA